MVAEQEIDSKIECVDSLLSLLGCTDVEKMSRTFLAMSSSPTNCDLMRSHRVIPVLVQLLHPMPPPAMAAATAEVARKPREVRLRAAKSLSNIVLAHPADKQCRREAKVLRLLETLRMYADLLMDISQTNPGDFHTELVTESDEKEKDEQEKFQRLKRCLSGCNPLKVRVVPSSSSPSGKDLIICGKCHMMQPSFKCIYRRGF